MAETSRTSTKFGRAIGSPAPGRRCYLPPMSDVVANLERGRAAHARREWGEALTMIHGVGRDAARIAGVIAKRCRHRATLDVGSRALAGQTAI